MYKEIKEKYKDYKRKQMRKIFLLHMITMMAMEK